MALTRYEMETIINWNLAESVAYLFTYEKRVQKRMEVKLGLKPIMVNGFGGKEYVFPKKLCPLPRIPRKGKPLTEERKKILKDGLARGRKTRQANKAAAKPIGADDE